MTARQRAFALTALLLILAACGKSNSDSTTGWVCTAQLRDTLGVGSIISERGFNVQANDTEAQAEQACVNNYKQAAASQNASNRVAGVTTGYVAECSCSEVGNIPTGNHLQIPTAP